MALGARHYKADARLLSKFQHAFQHATRINFLLQFQLHLSPLFLLLSLSFWAADPKGTMSYRTEGGNFRPSEVYGMVDLWFSATVLKNYAISSVLVIL